MEIVEKNQTDQPAEITDEWRTTKTRMILAAIDRLETKLNELQDVSQAVREIQQYLGVNNSWKNAIIRSLRQFISLIDPK